MLIWLSSIHYLLYRMLKKIKYVQSELVNFNHLKNEAISLKFQLFIKQKISINEKKIFVKCFANTQKASDNFYLADMLHYTTLCIPQSTTRAALHWCHHRYYWSYVNVSTACSHFLPQTADNQFLSCPAALYCCSLTALPLF